MAEHLLTLPPASRVNTVHMMRQMRPAPTPEQQLLAKALHEHGAKSDLIESRTAFAESAGPSSRAGRPAGPLPAAGGRGGEGLRRSRLPVAGKHPQIAAQTVRVGPGKRRSIAAWVSLPLGTAAAAEPGRTMSAPDGGFACLRRRSHLTSPRRSSASGWRSMSCGPSRQRPPRRRCRRPGD